MEVPEPRLIWDIIEKILGNLSRVDLKACRLVCRQWNDFIKRADRAIYLDWKSSYGKDPALKFVKTLKSQNLKSTRRSQLGGVKSALRCKTLRIKNGSSLQFKHLLNDLSPPLLLSTFGNVSAVELKGCTIPLSLFFKLLSTGFPSIKVLCLFDMTFSGHHGIEKGTLTLPAVDKLRILQKNGDAGIDSLLKGLSLCLTSVEEFEFNIRMKSCKIIASDLTPFLHKSLGILRLNWECSTGYSDGYASLIVLPIFEWPDASAPLITQLHLSFDQITMDSSFIMTLTPFLLRCVHLKQFSLGRLMDPQVVCLLPKFVTYTQKYEIFATNDTIARAKEVKRGFNDLSLQSCLSRLWVKPIRVKELRDILPIREGDSRVVKVASLLWSLHAILGPKLIFGGCRELSILIDSYQGSHCRTRGYFSPTFTSFNLCEVVSSFPCLTKLTIIDGPEFNYRLYGRASKPGKEQWAEMSKASIGDKGLQLILGGLSALKSIKICANMRGMTDFGLTGRSGSKNTPQGVPISNLRGIEEVVLKGLGPGVTDVSCQFAFKGCQELFKITLFGDTRFTTMALSKLKRSLNVPLPDSCEIQLI